jgi:hypothetical protein
MIGPTNDGHVCEHDQQYGHSEFAARKRSQTETLMVLLIRSDHYESRIPNQHTRHRRQQASAQQRQEQGAL